MAVQEAQRNAVLKRVLRERSLFNVRFDRVSIQRWLRRYAVHKLTAD